MNAYLVRIPEERSDYPCATDLEPPEAWWPTSVFAADTPAQAKADALRVWSSARSTGVYSDDWKNLRVRLLERDVSVPRGEVRVDVPRGGTPTPRTIYDRLWDRVADLLSEAA